MMKRVPHWITTPEQEEISAALRNREDLLHSVAGEGLANELGVARPRFENSRFSQIVPIALGYPRKSFPIRLSSEEYALLLQLPLSSALLGRLTND